MTLRAASARKVLVCQPLPNIAWPGAAGYSEFPSLGIARLAQDVADFGVEVRACYPRAAEDIVDGLASGQDVVVLGDFRYYTYFANPLPQIRACLTALEDAGWDGPVLVAGRHARVMSPRDLPGVRLAASYVELITLLAGRVLPIEVGPALDDGLPGPGLPAIPLLADGADLPGSFSRPGRRLAQLLLSKGCPFTCAFCEKAASPVATMSPKDLETALTAFIETGADRVIFWDEVFAWPHQANSAHLEALADSGVDFNCNARLDSLRPEFVRLLAKAGCKEILFGLEVIDDLDQKRSDILNLDRGKRRSLSTIRERVSLLRDHGIAPVGSLIVGLPDDDHQSIEERIAVADSLGLSHCYVRPLVPFPDAPLTRERTARGEFAPFAEWPTDEYDTFPHGYPVLGQIGRAELAKYCGR